MREIDAGLITEKVKSLCMEANYYLGDDLIETFRKCREEEESEAGKNILDILLNNAEIARNEKMSSCQDTGLAVVFAEVGQDVHITGGDFEEAIKDGVIGKRREHNIGYDYVGYGMYYKQIKAFLENFSHVNIFLYESFKANNMKVIKEIFRFLGVDDSFNPDITYKYNAAGKIKIR